MIVMRRIFSAVQHGRELGASRARNTRAQSEHGGRGQAVSEMRGASPAARSTAQRQGSVRSIGG